MTRGISDENLASLVQRVEDCGYLDRVREAATAGSEESAYDDEEADSGVCGQHQVRSIYRDVATAGL